MMTESQLQDHIKFRYPRENEGCEWKEYSSLKHSVNGHAGDDIVSYISGLANMEGGELIIGIEDNSGEIVGIADFYNYTSESIKLKIKHQVLNLPTDGFSVEEIRTSDTHKTVWIFHIPKHLPRRIVWAHDTAWKRVGDSLVRMDGAREQAIINEPLAVSYDWSAEIVADATIDDLDQVAITKARRMYALKNPRLKDEIPGWDDATFLNNARITIKGKITNAAIVLLGKPEAEVLMTSGLAQIYWVLMNKDGKNQDYQTFTCPMMLAVDEVFAKIRNIRYRYQNDSSIFPEEMDRYDSGLIREALHNCIAHQDYPLGGRITVVENEDGYLVFTNLGSFLPGNIESILLATTPPEMYRNPFLANAMVSLNMIDTLGGGIKSMFFAQRYRLFPMPEYDLSENKVSVTITGKVIDDIFAELLLKHVDLSINEIYLLDKVQKKKTLTDEEARLLKQKKYIEGRKPHYYLSKPLSDATGQKIKYTKNKGFRKQQCHDMIMTALEDHQVLTRKDIDDLLLDLLSPLLTDQQKKNCIGNYLSQLRMSGQIVNMGTKRHPQWIKNKNPQSNE